MNVLAKLDTIIENQQEQLLLLRNITASTHVGSGEALEELIPSKINSFEELMEFDEKLQDTEFKKKMVCHYSLSSFLYNYKHTFCS